MEPIARKAELNETIQTLEKRRAVALDELAELERSFDAHRRDVATLTEQRDRECEAEALGRKSRLGEIEAKLSTAAARVRGSERLTEAKRHAIDAFRTELEPLYAEINSLDHEDEVQGHLAEVARAEEAGRGEIDSLHQLTATFGQRINDLRTMPESQGLDPRVIKAAKDAAFKLERKFAGMPE